MLFVVTGQFKPNVEAQREAIHERYNEHVMQHSAHVRLGGPLFDAQGLRCGVLLVIEVHDRQGADAFLKACPYEVAGLYERAWTEELRPEVGYPR